MSHADTDERIRLEKVVRAMLSMQRASWEQGVAAQALWEAGFDDQAYLMAKECALRQTDDGRLGVLYSDTGATDPGACGEVVHRFGILKDDPELREADARMLAYLDDGASRAQDGTYYHTLGSREMWIDSMYMTPPYLAVTGRHASCRIQVEGLRRRLWNPEKALYAHQWDDDSQGFRNGNLWGVGNGWALAGLARIIDATQDSEARNFYIACARECIDGCLQWRRSDGLFHNVVDDPNTFVEANLSQMLAYAMYRGAASGWLPAGRIDEAEGLRAAAATQVDGLGYVRNVCGAPWFDRPGRAVEGQAFFILMESARAQAVR